jgi:hypothetical protein
MTEKRPKGAPKGTQVPKSKRQAGFLICEACRRAVPYQGMTEPIAGSEPWPLHRCGLEVRAFDRFVLADPFRPGLPPASVGAGYPEGWL